MNTEFAKNPWPNDEALQRMSQLFGLNELQMNAWFEHMREKMGIRVNKEKPIGKKSGHMSNYFDTF